jgi:septum formation protein
MISPNTPLLLASGSPRRSEILSSLGLPFVARTVDVDESAFSSEAPDSYVARITHLKMAAALAKYFGEEAGVSAVLAADTTVALGGRIFGKPGDLEEAREMIGALSGRSHQVLTAYSLVARSGERAFRTVETEVTLRRATEDELNAYVQTGEGLDKAGAYGIQGRASFLVERISGSYLSVVGLPVCELIADLKMLGLVERYP